VIELDLKYRFQFYKNLDKRREEIFSDIKKAADETGIPPDMKGKFGLGGGSGTPPTLPNEVIDAMENSSRSVVSLGDLVDEIRSLVKDVYGDEFDAAPVSTCEAALWLSFDVLATPPLTGRGMVYRSRYIAPYERHLHHQAAYGFPFPPKYSDTVSDRGVSSGEFSVLGKRLNNLDTIIVPLNGAKYETHGIKHFVTPILNCVDPDSSLEKLSEASKRHSACLAAFTSMAYDTVGYGYGKKDAEGVSKLQKGIGNLAESYDVPYIADNARGMPFLGTDPRKINADIILYSMDKAVPGPTSGLIIGKNDVMVPIRKAMGMHGSRKGSVSSYGKAAYVGFDPGKEALAGQIAALKLLKENPDRFEKNLAKLHKIVKSEFQQIHSDLKDGIIITKSTNGHFIEVNYSDTWKQRKFGIPIFTIEDMYAGSNLIQEGQPLMGIKPCLAYDGNIMIIGTRQGTTDERGLLIEEKVSYGVKGLVKIIEIICKHAEII
jgi:hypothetical protein